MSILSNIWAGMGSLNIKMPRTPTLRKAERFSLNQDLRNLQKDNQRIISDMNKIIRKAAKNG